MEENKLKEEQRSDVKKYIEFMDDVRKSDSDLLKKIAPIPNASGVMVVEVSKVVRDLKMLEQTFK
jgi:hypothetical protein